jgi:nucleoside-diphosphate-sugar epimerase
LNLGLIERRLPVIPVVGDDNIVATSRVFVFVDDCIRAAEQQLDALEYEMEYA